MATDSNKLGPGEIKQVSENYMHVEKGTIHKESFWISKYIADAFDGKTLSRLIDEEELGRKYHCDKEPLQGDQYAKDLKFQGFDNKATMEQILTKVSMFLKIIKILEN